jgi:hypothetical protein
VGALRGAPFVHAQKRGGTIRIIPIADLKGLDPIWTTASVTRDHAYLVYDTLFASASRSSRRWWTSTASAATT